MIKRRPEDIQRAAYDIGIAALSGAAMAASFPDFGLWPLAWLALAPFLFALRGKTATRGFFMGFAFGVVFFESTVWWVINTMTDYGHLPMWMAALAQALMIAVMSCYTGLFAGAFSWVSRRVSFDMALAMAPFSWVTIEFFRAHSGHLSFPWSRIADSQYTELHIIQIADIAGEEGIGFMMILFSVALVKTVDWIIDRKKAETIKPKQKFPAAWAAAPIALLAATYAYGTYRLQVTASGAPVKTALIQGNIDQARKWNPDYIQTQIDIYTRRTIDAGRKGAKLIVWPEAAAPFVFGRDYMRSELVMDAARIYGADIILGAPWGVREGGELHEYNRAWLVRPDGGATSYDKMHLVPFGEYVPFRNILNFVSRVVYALGEMMPGSEITLLDAGAYKAGAQICFEIIFPEYSREIARKGGAVIVNITNDSWYGDSPASRQSMSIGVFRAVENRLPLLRAAQSGVSAIISPTGKIVSETPLFVETTLFGEFTPRTSGGVTIYAATGDMFSWFCAAVSLFILGYAYMRGEERRYVS